MAETKDKIVTVESLKELHEHIKETCLLKTDYVDYMIERNIVQSTQNDASWEWECEKWNSGKFHCVCRIPYQVSGVTLNGSYISLLDGSILRPQLPITLVNEPYVFASLQNTQGKNHWIIGVDIDTSLIAPMIAGIKIAANDVNDNSETDVCSGVLNIKVEGKWK
jgi:hypothetical protein